MLQRTIHIGSRLWSTGSHRRSLLGGWMSPAIGGRPWDTLHLRAPPSENNPLLLVTLNT
ncbi:unnamed protein product [Callosobruchus maculatus]|uniref:Uncharacterized protein n=1 Tax=Callosobruchus maculatus TaxID=64391 RepID=A0A653CJ36_CALMS|nr:unnamed protein product [Callosobruchus maculatus]